jgi:DNA helicase-2/ATP-dependent DNA helicase PcrA
MKEDFLKSLTASQKKAALHKDGPLLVIAGPGSGKTRVITHRIAALIDSGVKPNNICAITFTNKAADEMRQRAVALGASGAAHISTFHSLCVRILRHYAKKAGIKPNFSIYDETDQARCARQAVKDCQLDATDFSPARMLEAVSRLKNNLIGIDTFRLQADDFFSQTLAKIYKRYEDILAANNALDFDDLLLRTAFLFAENEDVCTELSRRFKYLLIDEYQDTNHAQYSIAKYLVCTHNNICAAGDPDQSIYRWRGADIRNILDFEKDWPDALVVKLEENFRSTPNILKLADELIVNNKNRKQKILKPVRDGGQDAVIAVFDDEQQEALGVAEIIAGLAESGASLKDIAVFYRVNAASRVLEEAFIKSRIPYQIVRGTEFYNRKEIRDMLAYMKVIVNPTDQVALLRIINTPVRGIGKTTIEKVRSFADSRNIGFFNALKKVKHIESLSDAAKAKLNVFMDMVKELKKDASDKVSNLAEKIFADSGLKNYYQSLGAEGKDAIENINELINAAALYDEQADEPSLVDYLQQVSLFSDVDGYDTTADRVALMTLHAAKGLEFENVFIVGVEEGLLPHERTDIDDVDDLEEERRLFFVGITRAKTGLHISYARYRTIRGQLLRTIPSQFLYELGADFNPYSEKLFHYDNEDDDLQQLLDSKLTSLQFKKGQLVCHNLFGTGTITGFVDLGLDSKVTVKFDTGQTKTLMLKYTNLSKL